MSLALKSSLVLTLVFVFLPGPLLAKEVVLPFSIWRLLLPWDGEVISIPPKPGEEGYNRWPKNAHKGPFEQHEMVEIAFGWKLRAKQGDRKNEGPIHAKIRHERVVRGSDVVYYTDGGRLPGFKDTGDYIAVTGGWRAHRRVPIHNDYFDGTFTAKLRPKLQEGRLVFELYDLNLEWNSSGIANILHGFTFGAIGQILKKEVFGPLEHSAETKFNDGFHALHAAYLKTRAESPVFRRLADRTTINVRGTTIVFVFNTNVPDNPNGHFPPKQ